MLSKKQQSGNQQLKHSLNSNCYFPLARDVKVNIIPTTFKELFKIKQIHLPIFQRQYCWSDKVLRGFWNDLLKLTRRPSKHNIGKLFVFEQNNKILVIDGQQRITTALILLTSMKHQLNKIKMANKNNMAQNIQIDKFIDKIDMILFNDNHHHLSGNGLLKKGQNQIISKDESKSTDEDKEDEVDHHKVDVLHEGIQVDFIRFLPTYLDRCSFYRTILDHDGDKNAQKLNICVSVLKYWLNGDGLDLLTQSGTTNVIYNYYGCDVHDNDDSQTLLMDDDLDDDSDDDLQQVVTTRDIIMRSKDYFDGQLKDITSIQTLRSIYDKLLNNFTFVYLGIPQRFEDKGYHIYQWTFECALAAAKIFQIKRPGIDQRANELFKNYILSFFITKGDDIMYEMYMKWIGLMKSFNDLDKFDAFLVGYIDTKGYYPYDKYQDLVKSVDVYLKDAVPDSYCHIIRNYLDKLIIDAKTYLKNE